MTTRIISEEQYNQINQKIREVSGNANLQFGYQDDLLFKFEDETLQYYDNFLEDVLQQLYNLSTTDFLLSVPLEEDFKPKIYDDMTPGGVPAGALGGGVAIRTLSMMTSFSSG